MSQHLPETAAVGSRVPRWPASWRVLVVQNDPRELRNLAGDLRRHGHHAHCVRTGGEALAAHADADVVLLDLELPDLDGLEICREIRAASDVAIIMISTRESELDLVLGLQAGADDYVVRPYGFRELMARMTAIMRRICAQQETDAGQSILRGRLRIDAGSREVLVDGRRVEVTRKEFDLLWLLATTPDAVVSRRQIMHQVWGDSWSRRTIDTHVSSLRSKLGCRSWILTVRGVGFRLGSGDLARDGEPA